MILVPAPGVTYALIYRFVGTGDGYYTIVHRNSGYLIDVYHAETTNSASAI